MNPDYHLKHTHSGGPLLYAYSPIAGFLTKSKEQGLNGALVDGTGSSTLGVNYRLLHKSYV